MVDLWRIYGGFMEDLSLICGRVQSRCIFIIAQSRHSRHQSQRPRPSPRTPRKLVVNCQSCVGLLCLCRKKTVGPLCHSVSDLFQDVHQDVSNSLYFHSFTRCPWIQNKISGVALFFRLLAEYAEWKEGAILPDITVLQFDLPPPSFDMTWS